MKLVSETHQLHAIVVGSSGGIGRGLCEDLLKRSNVVKVTGLSRSPTEINHENFTAHQIDIIDEASIIEAVSSIEEAQLIIIATGILHDEDMMPEKSLSNISMKNLQRAFDINTIGPALLIKHLSKKMATHQPSFLVALSAKVGSISDNLLGGWYGYRASKAALNMIIKTASIEVQRFHPNHVVMALHPGTVTTDLSNPFTTNYPKEKLIDPAGAAERLLNTLDTLGPANNGHLINWDGTRITF